MHITISRLESAMNKSDLVESLYEMNYCKNQAREVLGDIFRTIGEALVNGESVTLRGFGTFEVVVHKGHHGFNANKGEYQTVEDYKVVKFRPAEVLTEAVRTDDVKKLKCLSNWKD